MAHHPIRLAWAEACWGRPPGGRKGTRVLARGTAEISAVFELFRPILHLYEAHGVLDTRAASEACAMNCYHHDVSVAAVGSCKACQKGLCRTCAIDVGKGLACRACEADVRAINEMFTRNVDIAQSVSTVLSRKALARTARISRLDSGLNVLVGVFSLFVAVIMVTMELSSESSIGVVPGIGLPLLAAGFGVCMVYVGLRRRASDPLTAPRTDEEHPRRR